MRLLATRLLREIASHPLSELAVPLFQWIWRIPVEHFLTPRTMRELFVRFPVDIASYRPIDASARVSYPCDGIVTAIEASDQVVKQQTRFSDCGLTSPACISILLLPSMFHHVFAPVTGRVTKIRRIGGLLRLDPTVKPHTNRRVLINFIMKDGASCELAFVGAIGVGSIHLCVREGQWVCRGEHVGFFDVGGSCIVLGLPHGHNFAVAGGRKRCIARSSIDTKK